MDEDSINKFDSIVQKSLLSKSESVKFSLIESVNKLFFTAKSVNFHRLNK